MKGLTHTRPTERVACRWRQQLRPKPARVESVTANERPCIYLNESGSARETRTQFKKRSGPQEKHGSKKRTRLANSEEMDLCAQQAVCTRAVTGKRHAHKQLMYRCVHPTCAMMTPSLKQRRAVCVSCANNCHHHNDQLNNYIVSWAEGDRGKTPISAYCDCPETGCCTLGDVQLDRDIQDCEKVDLKASSSEGDEEE